MGKSLAELPPTSNSLRGHLLRCHYVIRLSKNLLIGSHSFIDATKYGWERVGSVLFPDKSLSKMPREYSITCGCKACTRNCVCRSVEVSCTEFCKCSESCKNPF